MTDSGSRTWTLTVSAPAPWLSLNEQLHWAKRGAYAKLWRNSTYIQALACKALPKGLDRVRVDVVLHFSTNRRRDPSNYEPTVKPCIDALGPPFLRVTKVSAKAAPGYGLIPDDNPKHLDGPYLSIGDPWPASHRLTARAGVSGAVELVITDLTPDVSGLIAAELSPGREP